jgi:dTDP-4-amino-4,6-dideoxygalactose transaminase
MINVLKPKFRTDEILAEIKECLEKGWTGLGWKTVEFEDTWKSYTDLPHAHFLNSATSGLHLALNLYKQKYGWSDGDEIITTPLTFVSTNHVIHYERLTPVFADIDEHMCMDPEDVLKKITDKTRAVIFVGLGGNAGQLDRVAEVCKEKNVKLILDAAHMAGTRTKKDGVEVHVGWEADVSVFSFQAVKNLPTADSGMICFSDEEDDKLARQLCWLGIDKDTYARFNQGSYKWKYDVPNVGFKYHGNALTAAIGLVQLKYLDEDNEYRRKIAETYNTELSSVEWITNVETSPYTAKSAKHLHQILVDSGRDELVSHLYGNDIYPGVHYIDNTLYGPYKQFHGTAPKSHECSERVITLPIHCNLTQDDLQEVIRTVKSWSAEA